MTPLFRTSAEIEIACPGETLIKRIQITKAEETFHFQVNRTPHAGLLRSGGLDPQETDLSQEQGGADRPDDPRQSRGLPSPGRPWPHRAARRSAGERRAAQSRAERFVLGRRLEAVRLVGKLNGDEARAALLAIAKGDAKSSVRREALVGLANFSHDETRRLRSAGDRQ